MKTAKHSNFDRTRATLKQTSLSRDHFPSSHNEASKHIFKGFDCLMPMSSAASSHSQQFLKFKNWKLRITSHNNFKGLENHFHRIAKKRSIQNQQQHCQQKRKMISQYNRTKYANRMSLESAQINKIIHNESELQVRKVDEMMDRVLRQPIFKMS